MGGVWFKNSWDSSYSMEDIISNLIGLYAVIYGYSVKQIMDVICKKLKDPKDSLEIYDTYLPNGIGSIKTKISMYNKPIFFPSRKCKRQKRLGDTLPMLLNNITPAQYGPDFIQYKEEYAADRIRRFCQEHPYQNNLIPAPPKARYYR